MVRAQGLERRGPCGWFRRARAAHGPPASPLPADGTPSCRTDHFPALLILKTQRKGLLRLLRWPFPGFPPSTSRRFFMPDKAVCCQSSVSGEDLSRQLFIVTPGTVVRVVARTVGTLGCRPRGTRAVAASRPRGAPSCQPRTPPQRAHALTGLSVKGPKIKHQEGCPKYMVRKMF